MSVVLLLALNFSGFAALCLAMEKHQHEVRGRALGWLLLLVTFALAVSAQGWGIGSVLWLGTLSAGAAVLSLWLLPYRRGLILPAAIAAPVVAGMAFALLH